MNWLQRQFLMLAKRGEVFTGIPPRDPVLAKLWGGRDSNSGVTVTETTALNISAVWQAVTLLSSSVANLPVQLKKRKRGSYELDDAHVVNDLITFAPNTEMTWYTFCETLMAHALTYGNGYATIEMANDGEPESSPIALWPVPPAQMRVERDERGLAYRFTGRYEGEIDRTYRDWEVLHIKGLGFDGLVGYSPIQLARESLGLALATEESGARFFGSGMQLSGMLNHPGNLSEEAMKNLRESWNSMHGGISNAHKVGILEEGMTFSPVSISPEDAQFLQTRQFQVVEIARWYNVPPHMLRDLSQATFSNIEEQGIDFLTYSLAPWMTRWEQELLRKLFSTKEQRKYVIEHNTMSLLKTNTAVRYEAYNKGRQGGWLSVNDIRFMDGLPSIGPDGDKISTPLNMVELGEKAPIPAQTITDVMNLISAQKPLPEVVARSIIRECIPPASDTLINGLIAKLVAERIVTK